MLVTIIAIILSLVLSALWIIIPQRKLPEERRIPKKKYIGSFFMSLTVCSIIILVFEMIFDRIIGLDPQNITSVGQALFTSFIRAAIIEESFKYLFVKRALKKIQPKDNLQFMLVAGTIGMGYGVMEKLVLLEPGALITNAVFPFHIFFQFIMAFFLFKAATTPEEDKKKRVLYNVLSIVVAVIVHGIWDTFMFIGELIDNGTSGDVLIKIEPNENISTIVLLASILIGFAGTIFVIVRLKKMEVVYLPDAFVDETVEVEAVEE